MKQWSMLAVFDACVQQWNDACVQQWNEKRPKVRAGTAWARKAGRRRRPVAIAKAVHEPLPWLKRTQDV
jgi:hypothetical protein